jgi:ABC-type sugar transport system ATPase subunit
MLRVPTLVAGPADNSGVEASSLVTLEGVTKRYGGTVAVQGVDLEIRSGEVHALLGPNGAGKSTLANLIGGFEQADEGEIRLGGERLNDLAPREISDRGVHVVPQRLDLFSDLSVSENLALILGYPGRWGFASRRKARALAVEALTLLGHEEVDSDELIENLRTSASWLVALSAALARKPRLLILDESTAALPATDAARLYAIVRARAREGLSVIVITHRLGELRALADRITVLREGRVVGTVDGTAPTSEIINLMFGRALAERVGTAHESTAGRFKDRVEVTRNRPHSAGVALELEGVSTRKLRTVNLTVEAGEIVGVAGALGSGRTELANLIAGLVPKRSGEMRLWGQKYAPRSTTAAISAGVRLLPQDRDANGLLPGLSLAKNMTIGALDQFHATTIPIILSRRREALIVDGMRKELNIVGSSRQEIMTLSGGNRQKVLLARALLTKPSVLLLDDPTAGLDFATRHDLHQVIGRFAAEGNVVMVVSDEFDELLRISTRIIVMRDGELVASLPVAADLTEEHLAAIAYASEDRTKGHRGSAELTSTP